MTVDKELLLSPMFIVGAPRSGTTWLQNLLLESQYIFGGQESHFYSLFYPAFSSVLDTTDRRGIGLSSYWTHERFNEQMREVWINTFASLCEPQSRLLLEKTPFHALYIDKITEFLPKSKFIHLIRDSRSVTASLLAASKSWGDYWAPNDTKKAALEWYRHVKYARASKTAEDSSRYMEIHYEDLLSNPLSNLLKIYEFAGLPIDEIELQNSITNQSFKMNKKDGARIPGKKDIGKKEPEGFLRKGSSEAWRQDLNWYQKAIVWRYTRKLMSEVGYNWQGRSSNVESV
ncbi:MAG: hypothetical protein CMH22_11455 [Methylophaga sp.]|uniref:sulfotransferase family protein n=1 Tax=Methylophaga sp. UBA678 TaxID=1946901 RepID=UPI000C38574E|nr:sulfotransferase [Methylophaga sp. UBA678]MAX52587.1 hypothetical protein [Methylophaga sp.]|tara:strand:- start:35573 stop:36436 length:864 start_codon:yes stop_codon:yes gene_type:complete